MAVRFACVLLAGMLGAPLGGCLSLHPPVAPSPQAAEMRPELFFAGPSEGVGTLRLRIGQTQLVQVESTGAFEADSVFRLDQTIQRTGHPTLRRSWTMRRTAPGRYTGTLTEATGPVALRVDGPTLRIRYPMGRLLRMEQRLVLQADGVTAVNLSTVSLLGLPIARLFEIIRRVDPPAQRPTDGSASGSVTTCGAAGALRC